MRALEPTQSGTLTLAGFQIGYEVFGDPASPPLLLLPSWQITHSRSWKMQVPFFARFCRVITMDQPGNGHGERTEETAAFEYDRVVAQAVGLLDYLGVDRADVIGISRGVSYGLLLAARYPERMNRLVLVGNSTPPDQPWPAQPDPAFWERRVIYEEGNWGKWNGNYWCEDYHGFLESFFRQILPEPHSTKGMDDFMAWGQETTVEILLRTVNNPALYPALQPAELIARVQCPVLVLHGDADRVAPIEYSQKMAAARPSWEYTVFEGCGHIPQGRHPVRFNWEVARFLGRPEPQPRIWPRALSRAARRALFVSSPIGLGHVQRDLAIARELRRRAPDLQIDWLAQPPVTGVLERNGETIHPLSRHLANEAAHMESTAGEHELPCFQAFREMDEILLANFMVFLDAVRETPYDLWIGDEAWEVDYYLHENPELKTAPFVFLTDFLGWVPIDRSAGSREALLTADYNAEMLEQVARYKRVRDRAIYIGDYDDLLPERFGPGLPLIPEWGREHFQAVGYIAPFDPADYIDTRALRARLGYDPDRPLVMCAVGGTTVGRPLLQKALQAWPAIQRARPDAQCVVIAGPRIDPAGLAGQPGVTVRPYVHNLYEHLACADLGIVQGGLGTTMELTLTRRPFLYFPLKNHSEQVYHVAHRLDRHRAGRRMTFADTSAEALAEAALATLGADTRGYRAHDTGGTGRAAALIAELL